MRDVCFFVICGKRISGPGPLAERLEQTCKVSNAWRAESIIFICRLQAPETRSSRSAIQTTLRIQVGNDSF